MQAQEKVKAQAKITKTLSRGMFEVELDSGFKPLVYLCGKMKLHGIKVLVGDVVTVELSPYDPTRGRIIFRKTK